MTVQIILTTEFGIFKGEELELTEEQYSNILNFSKNYYETGFEMSLEDGGFAIFSPEIIKKSILKIQRSERL